MRRATLVVCLGSALALHGLLARPVAAHPRASLDACARAAHFGYISCADVNRAISGAATEFHIDEGRFRRVLRCESGLSPFASNGKYKGLAQVGPSFWAIQVPRFNAVIEPNVLGNAYSPFDNARVSAWVISHEGYRQWSCRG